jgi:hypothetical protein
LIIFQKKRPLRFNLLSLFSKKSFANMFVRLFFCELIE